MPDTSNLHGETLESVLDQLLDQTDATLFGYPNGAVLDAALTAVEDSDEASIRVLLQEATAQSVFRDFLISTKAAGLVDGPLSVRTVPNEGASVILTDEQVIAPISVEGRAAGLVDDDTDFVSAVDAAYEDTWEAASTHDFDVPGRDELLEALETNTSTELRADLEEALDGADSLGGIRDDVGIVTIALLLAARHEAQLYDLSEWGEETGVASKATFSRKKSQLEDEGLIETDSIPIDVGRPRLELHLSDDDLASVDAADFVEAVRSRLA